jgi:hypothetical protein
MKVQSNWDKSINDYKLNKKIKNNKINENVKQCLGALVNHINKKV